MSKGLEYSVQGNVRDYDTGAPIGGLKVRAYDKDFFRDQLLGGGVTDDNGRYEIKFRRDDFTGPIIKLERHPDIFVQVFDVHGELVYTSECSVLVDPGRQTSIDIGLHRRAPRATPRVLSAPFGVVIDRAALAKLSTAELVSAYRLARHPSPEHALTDRMRAAFPGLFTRSHGSPECGGNGLHETFRLLLKERAADPDPEADPYTGATVRQFFTANIVVKYTTAATLADGTANPNMLPAASATVPTTDANYNMPNGTLIGVVRANLADLDSANTEVAPTYIQKVGLLAEYALSHFISAPFSYRDPRGGLTRLEFQILGLGAGVAGYAVSSDYHMELNTSNSDAQNLGTVPHELFHLVQYRYNSGGGPTNGIRGAMLEGGARLLEESINETPNRYIESANDPSITTGVVS
jgi:hypothetical protein